MQAWYIPSPHRPNLLNDPFAAKYYETKIEFPSVIYEVEIIEQSRIEDRFYLEFKKVFWGNPKGRQPTGLKPGSLERSIGSKQHLPKRDIFYTKEEAIEEHKIRLLVFMTEFQKIVKYQNDGLENYDNYLQDEKYISPFTGKEK